MAATHKITGSILTTGITHRYQSSFLFPKHSLKKHSYPKIKLLIEKSKWKVKQSRRSGSGVEEGPQKPTVEIKKIVEFLYSDLQHLFDEKGIDSTAYDTRVTFTDPITKYNTISGYLLNIYLLKLLFTPRYCLHWVKQTGPFEITTRWTVNMTCILLPWKPELVLTGTSVMGVNPYTAKFCSHVDYWDSVKANDYFSLEGLCDVIKQLRFYKTPDLEIPKYQTLKRVADYEVRRYEPFIVVQTQGNKLSGSAGFKAIVGYIFGKNYEEENMPMTTSVFTETNYSEEYKVATQIALPIDKDVSSLADHNQDTNSLRKVGGIGAALIFSGKPTEDVVRNKERELRESLIRDGLKPTKACFFAPYNDPGPTWGFIMRNEVIIWLEDFSMDK